MIIRIRTTSGLPGRPSIASKGRDFGHGIKVVAPPEKKSTTFSKKSTPFEKKSPPNFCIPPPFQNTRIYLHLFTPPEMALKNVCCAVANHLASDHAQPLPAPARGLLFIHISCLSLTRKKRLDICRIWKLLVYLHMLKKHLLRCWKRCENRKSPRTALRPDGGEKLQRDQLLLRGPR